MDSGDLELGGYVADADYCGPDGDAENVPLDDPVFAAALQWVQLHHPQYYAEIVAAHNSGAFGFIFLEPGQGAYGATDGGSSGSSGSGTSGKGTVGVVVKKRSSTSVGGTIVHEWTHVRRVVGANDGTPDSPKDEAKPCQHICAVSEQAEFLSNVSVWSEINEPGLPNPVKCSEVKRLEANFNSYLRQCLDGGGTPACDIFPWIPDCS